MVTIIRWRLKLHIIIIIFAAILGYLFIGIPALNALTTSSGILVSYPIFLLSIIVFSMIIGKLVPTGKLGAKVFVIFLAGYLLLDILTPPLLVPFGSTPNLAPSQQMAGDMFFYTLFTSFALPHLISWILTYIFISLLLVVIMIFEIGQSRISRHLMGLF